MKSAATGWIRLATALSIIWLALLAGYALYESKFSFAPTSTFFDASPDTSVFHRGDASDPIPVITKFRTKGFLGAVSIPLAVLWIFVFSILPAVRWVSAGFKRPLNVYVKHGRLADVLALIQVLALDKSAHRSEAGLQEELQGIPSSSSDWRGLAREHPEFFRVRQAGENVVSLTARHVMPKQEGDLPPQLPTEFTSKLIQAAIDLHDRELKRAERWNFLVTAVIAAVAAVVVGLMTAYLKK